MALNCYTGLMGSGKSYEVVSTVLINALAKGRRVVSNIDGLNEAAIGDYIHRKFKNAQKVGQLVHVSNDDISTTGFFPTDKTVSNGTSIVKPGDLVVVDECWRFWGAGCKIPIEHEEFFRMHRHYVCPDDGQGCDIVMMIQDIGSLHRSVRSVVEFCTRTVKLKALGLHRRYRIEMFETGKLTKATKLDTFVKSYQSDIFPLYSSYKGGSGKEVVVDDRQNVFKNRKWLFIFGFIFGVSFLFWSVRILWKHFHSENKSSAVAPDSGKVVSSPLAPIDSDNSELRFVGRMKTGELGDVVVFADAANKLRYEYAAVCSGPGLAIRCMVDGKKVTATSGTFPSGFTGNGLLGGPKK